MICKFRDCKREAHKGWTTCAKHHSAGRSIAQEKRAKAAKR